MVTHSNQRPRHNPDEELAIRHWLDQLGPHYSAEDLKTIAGACALLVRHRGDQILDTGEGLIHHLLATADILVELRLDHETLIGALLNGCLTPPELTEAQISERFGPTIGRMVGDLARIDQIANADVMIAAKDQAQHEENLRRLLLGIAKDVRVVLIVLAERVHLMRSVKALDEQRRRKIALDTQRIYAPLANRLGIWQIKWELEDLSFRYLEPVEYQRIAKLLGGRRAEREAYIASVIETLRAKFEEAGLRAEITGRPKHIYSIWRKMKRKNLGIEQIFDLRAVRVLVEDVAACYAALGIVHGLWRHIPKEFDDYIATPKGNLYQSLHTAVIGPEDKPLEVQIRSFDMHRHAELGVAAHWAYKENRGPDAVVQRRVVWMRQWLELMHEGEDGGDFVERFKAEFEPVHVYVLTPQAKVIELPKGATPLDFAYAIHSEIGHRCRGARVNGRIVPLTQALQSGDTVEILTHKQAAPSRDWLSPHHGYLKTAKARNRVRQWFKQLDFDQHLGQGRAALDKELSRLGITEKAHLDQLATRFNLQTGNDLLAAIGRGDLAVGPVARQVGEPRTEERRDTDNRPAVAPKARPRSAESRAEVIVEDVDDLLTQMAHCCKPVPHDPIVGYVTRGRGVTIHRRDCPNVRNLPAAEAERLIRVRWADQPAGASYPVDIQVLAADRKGLLRDVSSVLSDTDTDVLSVTTSTDRRRDTASMRFTVEVHDNEQLDGLLLKLRQIPDILDVRRTY
ncbi:bifunctional (p)ppGpp synthetase/guanosine-3',5'-bis(diphosphate) 3'-pyrophosphohydrolase [Thioalkalicoccus limnaeus]|uniref:GTP pyrophosphokinase n=1 Tax=Thioalkalicoccus limnaeus TaxID=120681 RepID=A0ABV4BK93_9GAMM